jgi:hypothetical protein
MYRPRVAAWVVRAWLESRIGWRAKIGTAEVPRVIPGTSRPAIPANATESKSSRWPRHAERSPAPAV